MEKNYYRILDLDIEFLDLKDHIYNILKNNKIHKIGDLVSLKLNDILNFDGLDECFRSEIVKRVHSFDLCFPDELLKPKNYFEIRLGLKTYNLRKKFNILTELGKDVDALLLSIETLDLLPSEYILLKSFNIYTLRDLIKKDTEFIKQHFTNINEYSISTESNIRISYNRIIEQIHLLGLYFSDEKRIYNSESVVKIFDVNFFK